MFSNLTNSFRVLALCNSAVKSPFTTTCSIQLRDIHLHQPMFKSFEEKLGLPAKPKRPATPYFRFMAEVRPTVLQKNPKMTPNEVVATLAKMWRSLDDTKKEKFSKGFQNDLEAYKKVSAKYKDGLSEEDVLKIKEARFEKKERKTVLLQRKKCREMGKPRKPVSAFLDYLRKQTDRKPSETRMEFVKRMGVKWSSLTDAEKDKYRPSAQDGEKYRQSLIQWEEKMRKLGHYDIVTGESDAFVDAPKPRARTRKSSDE